MLKILIPVDWKLVDLDVETDPNLIGEALRHWCFVGRNGERGCYSTVALPDFFKKVSSGKYYDEAKKYLLQDSTNIEYFNGLKDFNSKRSKEEKGPRP